MLKILASAGDIPIQSWAVLGVVGVITRHFDPERLEQISFNRTDEPT